MTALLGRRPTAGPGAAEESADERTTRLRRRSRLLLGGLPFVLAFLLAAAKLVGMSAFAQGAIVAFDGKDAGGVASAAAGMGFLDLVETHKSHFAAGDAAVLAGDWPRARAEFEEALRRTGPDDECTVRVNLVLTIEKLGDAAREAGDAPKAGALYRDGEAVAEAAPQGCFQQNSPQNQQQQGQRLSEAKDRLQTKQGSPDPSGQQGQPGQQDQSGQQGPVPSPSAAPPPGQGGTPQDQRLRDLERKSQAGQQERSDGQQRDDYLDSPPTAPVDRPW
ncbi:hypothetical protein [Sinomonas atrocyanea]